MRRECSFIFFVLLAETAGNKCSKKKFEVFDVAMVQVPNRPSVELRVCQIFLFLNVKTVERVVVCEKCFVRANWN